MVVTEIKNVYTIYSWPSTCHTIRPPLSVRKRKRRKGYLESISPTFYEQLFCTKDFRAASFLLSIGLAPDRKRFLRNYRESFKVSFSAEAASTCTYNVSINQNGFFYRKSRKDKILDLRISDFSWELKFQGTCAKSIVIPLNSVTTITIITNSVI